LNSLCAVSSEGKVKEKRMPVTLLTVLSDMGLFSYLDPGAGSMAFQLLVASLLSGMVFFKAAVRSVRQYLATGVR
jgi:hypothetical protein